MTGSSSPVHPTTFLVIWAVTGLGLARLWPVDFVADDTRRYIQIATALPGVLLVVWSMIELRRHGTAIEHRSGTTSLVTSGPFRLSRNPLYLGLVFIMVALSIKYGSLWGLLSIPVAVAAIHRWTVVREEENLGRLFGDEYRRYKQSVRRWL